MSTPPQAEPLLLAPDVTLTVAATLGDVSNAGIEAVESRLLSLPQVEVPLSHHFAPGVYVREVVMPAGSFIIGHEHRTEHFNIVLTGRALVMMDGEVETIAAPCVFVSKPGVRKVLYIQETMRWATVHPTEETDPTRLHELLVIKSDSYRTHEADLARLQEVVCPTLPNH